MLGYTPASPLRNLLPAKHNRLFAAQIQLPPPSYLLSTALLPPPWNIPIPVLVSYGCHNEVPQPGWLNTTGMYSLPDLGAKRSKSRCQQGRAPLKESLSFASVSASSDPWHSWQSGAASLHLCPHQHVAFSVSGPGLPPLSLIKISVIEFKATLIQ